jgi:hypothetical protein
MFVSEHSCAVSERSYGECDQLSGTPFFTYNKNTFMKGTITTLLVGIVIGMLIAPEKGSVTRRKIADLIDDLSEAGQHLAEKPATPGMPGDLS